MRSPRRRRARRAARPGAGLRDQLSRCADHRGQISVQAAAPFRAGERNRRRSRGGGRGCRWLVARRPDDRRDRDRRTGREGRHPCRARDPAAARAQLRGRLGAAPDLRDRDPRPARSRPDPGGRDAAGARRGGRGRHGGGRARQGVRGAGRRGGFVRREGRGGDERRRRRGARLSARPFDDGRRRSPQLFKDAVGATERT